MDMAHSNVHPKRIAFYALAGAPPGVGGETVLVDMRAVYKELEAAGVPAAFASRGGVRYWKTLWSAATSQSSYTWQRFFFSQNKSEVVARVGALDPEARVSKDDTIEFSEVLPAVHAHPVTGEPLWFNGVHTNHGSYYQEADHVDTTHGVPFTTSFADGSIIPEATIAQIRATMWQHSLALRLESGDVVLVDNMLVAHGRMSWMPGALRKVLLTHFSDARW